MKQWIALFSETYRESSYRERTMIASAGSFALGLFIGIGKLIVGIIYSTPWFIVTAIYYLLLCLAKGRVLQQYHTTRELSDPFERYDRQFRVYRHDGLFICLIGICYLFVCLRMYFLGESTSYPFYWIYGVAAVAFYKIGTSIHGMIVTRRMKNPLLSTMKTLAFVDACVSIVAVQCALLSMEGANAHATTASALLGTALSIVFIAIGLFMFCKKKKYPKVEEMDIADVIKKEKARAKNAYFNRSRNTRRRPYRK